MMDLELTDKKVLITGASKGIGEGLAWSFAEQGCELYLVARSADALDRIATEVAGQHGVKVHVLATDLKERGSADKVASFAGEADILVNNAGAILGGTILEMDEDAWRDGWELKVFGYINMTRAFYRLMAKRGHGVILNNIGIGGENFDFEYLAGSAGNAALMAFTRALGGRSLQHNIRVLGVNPGVTATERSWNHLKKRATTHLGDSTRYEELLRDYPLGRAALVSEITDLIVFLSSPRSAYTSGVIMTVDGGVTSNRSV